MLICHLHTFFEEISIEVLCPFFTFNLGWGWLLSCSSLYILDLNSSSDNTVCNFFFFSYSLGCLFTVSCLLMHRTF